MSQFIALDRGGWVNLDHVQIVTQRKRKLGEHENWVEIAVLSNGSEHELLERPQTDAIIPATGAPLTVIAVWILDEEPDKPTIERAPIIAWLVPIDGAYPLPIAPGFNTESDKSRCFIELPDGKYRCIDYEGEQFDTLNDVIAAVRQLDRVT